jgi:CxxC motif-containing protein (DUF1111 family)
VWSLQRSLSVAPCLFALPAAALLGCSDGSKPPLTVVSDDPADLPIASASSDLVARFHDGDRIFDIVFREPDGLGPVYIRASCGSCHQDAGRGPGSVQKMAVVLDDGITPGDQSELLYGHSVRAQLAAGGMTPVVPPSDPHVKVTTRAAPAVLGRGYVDAIDEAEVRRVAAEQAARTDGIHGVVNEVTYQSQPNPDTRFHQYTPGQGGLVGRFGLKARIATIDDFVADAAQGDMSMTSVLRPTELPNPDNLTDDQKAGPDLDADTINAIADYMRLIAIPTRPTPSPDAVQLFADTQCAGCHVPSLKTRADYPLAQLAGIDAPIFSDLLLHDMGATHADGLTDGTATSRQWKTPPLIGLRLMHTYLHDGRAMTIADAIEQHDNGDGSEAADSIARFHALSSAQQQTLIDYVEGL